MRKKEFPGMLSYSPAFHVPIAHLIKQIACALAIISLSASQTHTSQSSFH